MNQFKLQLYTDHNSNAKFIRFEFPNVNDCNEFFSKLSDEIQEQMISADDNSFSLDCSHLSLDEVILAMESLRKKD
jgi:hypothetical protein